MNYSPSCHPCSSHHSCFWLWDILGGGLEASVYCTSLINVWSWYGRMHLIFLGPFLEIFLVCQLGGNKETGKPGCDFNSKNTSTQITWEERPNPVIFIQLILLPETTVAKYGRWWKVCCDSFYFTDPVGKTRCSPAPTQHVCLVVHALVSDFVLVPMSCSPENVALVVKFVVKLNPNLHYNCGIPSFALSVNFRHVFFIPSSALLVKHWWHLDRPR